MTLGGEPKRRRWSSDSARRTNEADQEDADNWLAGIRANPGDGDEPDTFGAGRQGFSPPADEPAPPPPPPPPPPAADAGDRHSRRRRDDGDGSGGNRRRAFEVRFDDEPVPVADDPHAGRAPRGEARPGGPSTVDFPAPASQRGPAVPGHGGDAPPRFGSGQPPRGFSTPSPGQAAPEPTSGGFNGPARGPGGRPEPPSGGFGAPPPPGRANPDPHSGGFGAPPHGRATPDPHSGGFPGPVRGPGGQPEPQSGGFGAPEEGFGPHGRAVPETRRPRGPEQDRPGTEAPASGAPGRSTYRAPAPPPSGRDAPTVPGPAGYAAVPPAGYAPAPPWQPPPGTPSSGTTGRARPAGAAQVLPSAAGRDQRWTPPGRTPGYDEDRADPAGGPVRGGGRRRAPEPDGPATGGVRPPDSRHSPEYGARAAVPPGPPAGTGPTSAAGPPPGEPRGVARPMAQGAPPGQSRATAAVPPPGAARPGGSAAPSGAGWQASGAPPAGPPPGSGPVRPDRSARGSGPVHPARSASGSGPVHPVGSGAPPGPGSNPARNGAVPPPGVARPVGAATPRAAVVVPPVLSPADPGHPGAGIDPTGTLLGRSAGAARVAPPPGTARVAPPPSGTARVAPPPSGTARVAPPPSGTAHAAPPPGGGMPGGRPVDGGRAGRYPGSIAAGPGAGGLNGPPGPNGTANRARAGYPTGSRPGAAAVPTAAALGQVDDLLVPPEIPRRESRRGETTTGIRRGDPTTARRRERDDAPRTANPGGPAATPLRGVKSGEPANHRSLLIVGLVLALLVGGVAAYLVVTGAHARTTAGEEAKAKAAAEKPRDISSQAVDPAALTEQELFPGQQISVGGGTYQVLKTQASECPGAVTDGLVTMLSGEGCTQVVRATLKSPDGQYLVTAGIFNLRDAAAATDAYQQIGPVLNAQKGRFTGLSTGGDTEALVRAATTLGWHPRGHFLMYAIVAHSDGKPIDAQDAGSKQIISDLAENYLGNTVIGARAAPSPKPTAK